MEAEQYRIESQNWAVKRDEVLRISKEEYLHGNKSKAKEYSDLGKEYTIHYEKYRKMAADGIFHENNERRPFTVIDLHRLYVSEAIEKLSERIIAAMEKNVAELEVIVGQGHHSGDGTAKIKPSVIQFAENNGMHYTINERNPGRICLWLAQSVVKSTKAIERDRGDSTPKCSENNLGFQTIERKKGKKNFSANAQAMELNGRRKSVALPSTPPAPTIAFQYATIAVEDSEDEEDLDDLEHPVIDEQENESAIESQKSVKKPTKRAHQDIKPVQAANKKRKKKKNRKSSPQKTEESNTIVDDGIISTTIRAVFRFWR